MDHICHIKWILLICMIIGSSRGEGQVLKYDTDIHVDEKGTKLTSVTLLIQINTREESELAEVAISHSPHQTLAIDFAMVKDQDGTVIRKLKKKDVRVSNDRSYGSFYEDNLITEFDLFSNSYPYQIEYQYTLTEEQFLYVAYWTPSYRSFNTQNASLRVEVPEGYKFTSRHSPDLEVGEEFVNGTTTITCEVNGYEVPEYELFAPPLTELSSFLSIVPSKFHYGVGGSFNSWESFGEWQAELNANTDLLTAAEIKKAHDLVDGLVDEVEIISKLYHYLQDHTKYINVSIDVGGLKSYPASYVASNGYGDCKALTTYMKALLKCVGIQSYYSKIYAGENPVPVIRDFPSPQSNHVILMVPLTDGDTVWLENTSNTLPFNYLGTFTHNRYAFVIDDDKSQLIKTPKLHPKEVKEERAFTLECTTNGIWDVNIDLNLQGTAFEHFRYGRIHRSESDQLSAMKDYIDFEGLEMQTLDLHEYHRDSTFIKYNIKGKILPKIRKVGNYEVISPLKLKIPKVNTPDTRSHPIRITIPVHKKDQSIYHFHELEEKKIQLPEKIQIDSEFGSYRAIFELSPEGVHVSEEFELKTGDYPLSQFVDFYDFLQDIHQFKNKSSILIL